MTSTVLIPLLYGGLPTVGWVTATTQALRWRRQVHTDRLTGLTNREGLLHAFTRTRRRGGPAVGLLLVDLDQFKQINDRYGHAVGNSVLCHVATQLAGVVHHGEVPVRLHGDEFAVLLRQLPAGPAGQDIAARRAERIAAGLAQPVTVDGVPIRVSATVGAAVSPRRHAELSTLLRVADQRMYAAKPGRHTQPNPSDTAATSGVQGRWS